MELKNFFAQDMEGNVIPSPSAYVYEPGTTTLVTGLKNASGGDLDNPFAGTAQGQVQFAAPDGEYDLRVVGSGRDFTLRVRFIDAVSYVAELALKAPLASPVLTGTPTAPTPTAGDNTTKLATTAFVKGAVDGLIAGAPGALDTLDELAAALADDANFASTVTTSLASKVSSATLAASGGSALVGADDGASGTLWTTVQGFINKLLSSAGASVIGYVSPGTSPSTQTVKARLDRMVHAEDFGVGTGGSDATRLANAFARANALGVPLRFNAGTITLAADYTAPTGSKAYFATGVAYSGAYKIKNADIEYEHFRDGTKGADYTLSRPRVGKLWSQGDKYAIDQWQQNWSVNSTYWQWSDYRYAFYSEFDQNSDASPYGWPQATLAAFAVQKTGNKDFSAAFHAIAWTEATNGSVWGINTVVGNCQEPNTPLAATVTFLCGHEIDFQPAVGTTLTNGAGELINNFWGEADCAALAIASDAGGAWQTGIYVTGLQSTGTLLLVDGGVTATAGLDLSFANFTAAALGLRYDNDILFKTSAAASGSSMRSDSAGNLKIRQIASGTSTKIQPYVDTNNTEALSVQGSDGTQGFVARHCTGTAPNTAAAALWLRASSTNSRSLNAGGTVNASGADYAEYERKRDDCGEVVKGQIIGFDSDGLVTDRFDLAISFGVKSTDPNLVGGDTWWLDLGERPVMPELVHTAEWTGGPRPFGSRNNPYEPWTFGPRPSDTASAAKWDAARAAYDERAAKSFEERQAAWDAEHNAFLAEIAAEVAAFEAGPKAEWRAQADAYDAELEALRAKVDRIAYCGKVPVNVTGATPGQYIVPVDDGSGGITGQTLDDPTFEQFRKAVGQVRRVLDDGRAEIVVSAR